MSWSHGGSVSRLLAAVNLALLAACAAPERPAPGGPLREAEHAGPFGAPGAVRVAAPAPATPATRGGRLGTLLAQGQLPAPIAPAPTVLDALTAPMLDAQLVEDLGDRLQDALDAAEAEGRPVATWGTGALSIGELLGDDVHTGVCEIPQVQASTEFEGETWEIRVGLAMIENFVGGLSLAMGTLPEDCAADLLATGGDVAAAADCTEVDAAMFFPEGSDCRSCLATEAGDVGACVDAGQCAAEAPVLESRGGDLWNRVEGTLLSCAPDWTVPAYVLAHYAADGSAPSPFDSRAWGYVCAPFWDELSRSVMYTCAGGLDTLRIGVHGTVEGMRTGGDDTPWYRHRSAYVPRVAFTDGTEIRYAWEAYSSLGEVSYPVEPTDTNGDGVVDAGDDYYGYQFGSWGLNPLALRPDGTDPTRLDDTFARDWFAAITVKTATTRNGISILMANHTRCAADAWEDLDGDGQFRCTRTEDPVGGWLGDLPHFRWDDALGTTYPMPTVTLGSTGLPDPTIPGGIVAQVASAPTLEDPEWDGCTWNNTFVPDQAPLPDAPLAYTGAGSLTGDTWRFGGHPELDLRVLLYTNLTRDFCPDGIEP